MDFANETFLPQRLVFTSGGMDGMSPKRGPHHLRARGQEAWTSRSATGILVQMKTYTGQNNVGEFAIAGITVDPGILGSMAGYANKPYVNELLNLQPDDYQSLGFYLPSLKGMDKYGNGLYETLRKKAQVFDRDRREQAARISCAP